MTENVYLHNVGLAYLALSSLGVERAQMQLVPSANDNAIIGWYQDSALRRGSYKRSMKIRSSPVVRCMCFSARSSTHRRPQSNERVDEHRPSSRDPDALSSVSSSLSKAMWRVAMTIVWSSRLR